MYIEYLITFYVISLLFLLGLIAHKMYSLYLPEMKREKDRKFVHYSEAVDWLGAKYPTLLGTVDSWKAKRHDGGYRVKMMIYRSDDLEMRHLYEYEVSVLDTGRSYDCFLRKGDVSGFESND